MGATVTVGKKVAAFKSPSGKTGYVLFENTYEKNCYPHNPNWSCVSIGYLEDVIARIFATASCCEGGGLQGRNGYITPEGYITAWLTEMENPIEMPNYKEQVAFGENFYATIPSSLRERVLKGLEEEGFADRALALCGDGFEASLHDDFDVLRAIYVKHRNELGPWRFIGRYSVESQMYRRNCPELGFMPGKDASFRPTIPQMFDVGRDNLVVEQADGGYRVNSASTATRRFIEGYGSIELAHPGTFKKAFKAFRDVAKSAPKAGSETVIVVSMTGLDEEEKYSARLLQEIAVILGQETTEFETTLGEIWSLDTSGNRLLYNVMWLEALVWRPKLGSIPLQQESLFGEMELV